MLYIVRALPNSLTSTSITHHRFMEVIIKLSLLFFFCTVTCLGALALDFSIAGYSQADLASEETLTRLFETWTAKNGKAYADLEEKLCKFEVFKDNLKHVDEANKKRKSYWLGLNEFADMSQEDFTANYLGLATHIVPKRVDAGFIYENEVNLPESVDWTKRGAVTPVKNQGGCGKQLILHSRDF